MRLLKLKSYSTGPLLTIRVAFLALVAINMTVVCQGHLEGDRHVGAHLVIIDEPGVSGQPYFRATASNLGTFLSSQNQGGYSTYPQGNHVLPVTHTTARSCSVQPLSTPPVEVGGANVLGGDFALVTAAGARLTPLAASLLASWTMRDQPQPDSPPPQSVSLAPSI